MSDDSARELAADVQAAVGGRVSGTTDASGTPCLEVDRGHWAAVAEYGRDTLGLVFLDWLSAVDQPDRDPPGVDLVLHVAAPGRPRFGGGPGVRRLLMRCRVPDTDFRAASLTRLWPGVAWHERETFEMFGVEFTDFVEAGGLPLRPLLLPEGFEGTPLRKSFVLAARASKPWPGAKEPGESGARASSPGRRKLLPPGVPDPRVWGPREQATDGLPDDG